MNELIFGNTGKPTINFIPIKPKEFEEKQQQPQVQFQQPIQVQQQPIQYVASPPPQSVNVVIPKQEFSSVEKKQTREIMNFQKTIQDLLQKRIDDLNVAISNQEGKRGDKDGSGDNKAVLEVLGKILKTTIEKKNSMDESITNQATVDTGGMAEMMKNIVTTQTEAQKENVALLEKLISSNNGKTSNDNTAFLTQQINAQNSFNVQFASQVKIDERKLEIITNTLNDLKANQSQIDVKQQEKVAKLQIDIKETLRTQSRQLESKIESVRNGKTGVMNEGKVLEILQNQLTAVTEREREMMNTMTQSIGNKPEEKTEGLKLILETVLDEQSKDRKLVFEMFQNEITQKINSLGDNANENKQKEELKQQLEEQEKEQNKASGEHEKKILALKEEFIAYKEGLEKFYSAQQNINAESQKRIRDEKNAEMDGVIERQRQLTEENNKLHEEHINQQNNVLKKTIENQEKNMLKEINLQTQQIENQKSLVTQLNEIQQTRENVYDTDQRKMTEKIEKGEETMKGYQDKLKELKSEQDEQVKNLENAQKTEMDNLVSKLKNESAEERNFALRDLNFEQKNALKNLKNENDTKINSTRLLITQQETELKAFQEEKNRADANFNEENKKLSERIKKHEDEIKEKAKELERANAEQDKKLEDFVRKQNLASEEQKRSLENQQKALLANQATLFGKIKEELKNDEDNDISGQKSAFEDWQKQMKQEWKESERIRNELIFQQNNDYQRKMEQLAMQGKQQQNAIDAEKDDLLEIWTKTSLKIKSCYKIFFGALDKELQERYVYFNPKLVFDVSDEQKKIFRQILRKGGATAGRLKTTEEFDAAFNSIKEAEKNQGSSTFGLIESILKTWAEVNVFQYNMKKTKASERFVAQDENNLFSSMQNIVYNFREFDEHFSEIVRQWENNQLERHGYDAMDYYIDFTEINDNKKALGLYMRSLALLANERFYTGTKKILEYQGKIYSNRVQRNQVAKSLRNIIVNSITK